MHDASPRNPMAALPDGFVDPSKAYSLTPFWFWNDTLDEREITRQIDGFADHGVFGFVLHPRVGLPADCGWMSPKLLHFMRVAIEHAERRGMHVILYDEGMYPSGSASGHVVAEDPAYACRGLVRYDGVVENLPEGRCRVAVCQCVDGSVVTIVDQPIDSWIRGLHYTGDDNVRSPNPWPTRDTPETRSPAADLLNPDAVACFIRHSYQRYFDAFADHFGKTIVAVFTDEPMVLGRGNPYDARPGTTGILEHVNDYLGYDFTPHLSALWHDDEPDAQRHRRNYRHAINRRLEHTYYQPLHDWCASHGVALTGHPAAPQEIGHLRHFHWPGQDVILGDICPGEPAVTGVESTQAKAAASAAVHLGRARNANEFMGAYGHDIPLSLYQFVAHWLLVRGCNLLIPHAYFYSIRGPRIDECPPQLGPHSPWWTTDTLRRFHAACHRLCWLNANATPVVDVALVCGAADLPVAPARRLFEAQIDFHYLEERHLNEDAILDRNGIRLAGMHYRAAVAVADSIHSSSIDALATLPPDRCWLLKNEEDDHFVARLQEVASPGLTADPPQPWLRMRRLRHGDTHWILTFNEGDVPICSRLSVDGFDTLTRIDLATTAVTQRLVCPEAEVKLEPGELALFIAGRAL